MTTCPFFEVRINKRLASQRDLEWCVVNGMRFSQVRLSNIKAVLYESCCVTLKIPMGEQGSRDSINLRYKDCLRREGPEKWYPEQGLESFSESCAACSPLPLVVTFLLYLCCSVFGSIIPLCLSFRCGNLLAYCFSKQNMAGREV